MQPQVKHALSLLISMAVCINNSMLDSGLYFANMHTSARVGGNHVASKEDSTGNGLFECGS